MKKYITWMVLISCAFKLWAQSGNLDLTFQTGAGPSGSVRTTVIQPDGKIIIGGDFLTYNHIPCGKVARVNTDGSLDTSFNTSVGANGSVRCAAIQTDSKIIIGGDFDTYNLLSSARIFRINADGTPDTSFHTGSGFTGGVYAVAIQNDGKIVLGGLFSNYNGIAINNLLRLNRDGSLDTTFVSGSGPNASVQALAIQPDGNIVIGGDFTAYNGNVYLRLNRILSSGMQDPGFVPYFGANAVVYSLALQSDGKILVAGNLSNYNLQNVNKLVRLDADGSKDAILDPNAGTDQAINVVLVQSNGEILVAGKFNSCNGVTRHYIALLDSVGHLDLSFHPRYGADWDILATAIQSDGKIIIGGDFTMYDSIPLHGLARLNACSLATPDAISGSTTTLCGGTSAYLVNPVAGAETYEWTLPAGWSGSSNSTSINAVSNGTGGTISVKAYSGLCGYSEPLVDTITQILPPAVPICMVSVDTASTHNVVKWKRPHTGLVDSIFIYREFTTGGFTKIGAVPFDSAGIFHDYGANPNQTSFTYEISILDTCGVESPLSLYHSTIHLQNLGNGNLQWTFYQIEGTPNPVLSFNIYKDLYGNGNFVVIGEVPGTNSTFTDLNYNAFPNAVYVVDVNWGISCGDIQAVNTTRSNIRHIHDIDLYNGSQSIPQESISLYPNPAIKSTNLYYPADLSILWVEVLDELGRQCLNPEIQLTGRNFQALNIEGLASGIYTVRIKTVNGFVNKKLVIR